jgi:hypothetical protein
MPGVAILRRIGLVKGYNPAKAAQADTKGHTVSTARFIGSTLSTRSEDRDSGLNSDPDDVRPEPEKPVTFTIDDFAPIVKTLGGNGGAANNKKGRGGRGGNGGGATVDSKV